MLPEQIGGLAVGGPFQVLEECDTQEQNRLDARAAMVGAASLLKRGPRLHQQRINRPGEEPVAIIGREELPPGRAVEKRAEGEKKSGRLTSENGNDLTCR